MVANDPLQLLQAYLKPTPAPPGFTSREIVRRAVEFADPPRTPYSFIQPLESDFAELAVILALGDTNNVRNAPKGEMVFDEWGTGWRASGRAWGHAEVCPLADLSALDGFKFPDDIMTERVAATKLVAEMGERAGKYVVGADPIGSGERLRSLMGFESMMLSMYTERERFERLLDKLTDMTVAAVNQYAGMGVVNCFMTWDDWGLQTGLQIRPAQWREIFKPRYARIVTACHNAGMHYSLHSCGVIWEIIPDLIEIGVDILQIDQPRLMGVEPLAKEFGGKICFWNCVDIQWSVDPNTTIEEARAEAGRMAREMGRFHGGFIARQYPQPNDIEMPLEKHQAIYEGFMENGCR